MKLGLLIGLVASLVAGSAFASEVRLQGRTYTYSCGYFTNVSADLSLTYSNNALPWGTRVTVIYGFGGYQAKWDRNGSYQEPFEWSERTEIEATAVAPYTWGTSFGKTLSSRSETTFRNSVQFVIRLQLPDGRTIFENGSGSKWGFFSADLTNAASARCVDEKHPKPEMNDMSFTRVIRH